MARRKSSSPRFHGSCAAWRHGGGAEIRTTFPILSLHPSVAPTHKLKSGRSHPSEPCKYNRIMTGHVRVCKDAVQDGMEASPLAVRVHVGGACLLPLRLRVWAKTLTCQIFGSNPSMPFIPISVRPNIACLLSIPDPEMNR